jgi:uncharacterized damage-inducible protein DinB
MTDKYPALNITPLWALVNEDLIALLDLIPEDKLDWSPSPELWNFKGILLHICMGRHGLMIFIVKDGKESPDVLKEGQTKAGLREQLQLSWERIRPLLTDASLLDKTYEAMTLGEAGRLSGHELAFGQIEHDIHHRADILHYLRQLGIKHEEPDTLLRVIRERNA